MVMNWKALAALLVAALWLAGCGPCAELDDRCFDCTEADTKHACEHYVDLGDPSTCERYLESPALARDCPD